MRKSGHWGPFSGGQLTTMFVALILVVGFPFAAGAVTGSNVFVTDATSGAHAAVSATGAISVAGAVTATNASPKSLYQNVGYPGTNPTFAPVAAPPATKALVITSLAVDVYDAPGTGYVTLVISKTDATCATYGSVVGYHYASTLGTTSIPIPSGLVIPANRALCAVNGGITATVMVFGYLVAASSAPRGT